MAKQEQERGERRSRRVRWLHGEIKTPPFAEEARREAGAILRKIQDGTPVKFPQVEPLRKTLGPRCGAIRVRDDRHSWRIIYRVDEDAVLIVEVYAKKTPKIPAEVIDRCRKRLKHYDDAAQAHAEREKVDGH